MPDIELTELPVRYTLREYAKLVDPGITRRKEREHEAELRLIDEFFGHATTGCFVDIGANEPKRFSQTWRLEQQGWKGILVEPTPELCERLRTERPASVVVQAACGEPGAVGTAKFYLGKSSEQSSLSSSGVDFNPEVTRVIDVRLTTVDVILQETQLPTLDFVSIDVEGHQLDVLKGFDLARHAPRLLLVEDHLVNYQTHRYITARGYRLVKRTGLNNWYVPAGSAFALTTAAERFALWRKLWVRTPLRRVRAALRKLILRRRPTQAE